MSTNILPNASITGGGSGMQITNINLPTGTGQTVTVTMKVSTVGSGCAALAGVWNAVLWTGSSPGSGQTFLRDDVPPVDTSLSPPCGTLTVTKVVDNKGIGTKGPGDFTLKVGSTTVSSGATNPFASATYTVGETLDPAYTGVISGDCAANGSVTLAPGDAKSCTITNTFNTGKLTVTKVVENKGRTTGTGIKQAADFPLKVDGTAVTTGVANDFAIGSHTVSETGDPAYSASIGGDCGTDGSITLGTNDVKACTITNSLHVLTISGVPGTAYLNIPYDVTVTRDPAGNAPVTLAGSGCTLAVDPTSSTASPAMFKVTITAATSATCTITANAGAAYASESVTIENTVATTGVLGCGEPVGNNRAGDLGTTLNTEPPLAYIGNPGWGLVRAEKNKDGNPCTKAVPFDFNFDEISNTAEFLIPDTFGEKVAVEYVVLWRRVAADDVPVTVPPVTLAELAWLRDKDDSTKWKYVPGLACKEDDLEQENGSPLPILPNISPFNGKDAGGTVIPNWAADYPDYAYDGTRTAKMCIGQEGWTSVGVDNVPSSPTFGKNLRQYWHKVLDFADGAVRLSE